MRTALKLIALITILSSSVFVEESMSHPRNRPGTSPVKAKKAMEHNQNEVASNVQFPEGYPSLWDTKIQVIGSGEGNMLKGMQMGQNKTKLPSSAGVGL